MLPPLLMDVKPGQKVIIYICKNAFINQMTGEVNAGYIKCREMVVSNTFHASSFKSEDNQQGVSPFSFLIFYFNLLFIYTSNHILEHSIIHSFMGSVFYNCVYWHTCWYSFIAFIQPFVLSCIYQFSQMNVGFVFFL